MHAEEMAFFYELAANEQILSCPNSALKRVEQKNETLKKTVIAR